MYIYISCDYMITYNIYSNFSMYLTYINIYTLVFGCDRSKGSAFPCLKNRGHVCPCVVATHFADIS